MEAIAKYSRLWVIEESFRINKHNLKMRPIFHFTPDRIKAHIAICFMAFTILRNIQYKVNLTQKISPNEIIKGLFDVQSSILKHKPTGQLYRMPSVFKIHSRKIYRTFQIDRSQDPTPYI